MNEIRELSSSSENETEKKSESTPSDIPKNENPYLSTGNPVQGKAIFDKEKNQKRKYTQHVIEPNLAE